jgi:hypothetical protein
LSDLADDITGVSTQTSEFRDFSDYRGTNCRL